MKSNAIGPLALGIRGIFVGHCEIREGSLQALLLPTVPGLQVADGGPRAGDDLLLCVAVVDPAAGAGAAQPGRAPGHVAGAGGALAADQGAGALSTLTQVVS